MYKDLQSNWVCFLFGLSIAVLYCIITNSQVLCKVNMLSRIMDLRNLAEEM